MRSRCSSPTVKEGSQSKYQVLGALLDSRATAPPSQPLRPNQLCQYRQRFFHFFIRVEEVW